jgi:GMP synthase-like glutamine amidotransferase
MSRDTPATDIRVCILDNDNLDPAVADRYVSYGAMVEKMFAAAGTRWRFDRFNTTRHDYPANFDAYDAVLLTGSRADSFSDEPWVQALRAQVDALLRQRKKMVGICFGHQLIALCMGAQVGRAPQGWGMGRMTYEWCGPLPLKPAAADTDAAPTVSLLASHQDQVLSLPDGATLLARSDFCPVAAYQAGDHVLCVQPHPEFVEDYSAYLLEKRRALLAEDHHATVRIGLTQGHDGLDVARFMQAFVERPPS